ncbi:DUF4862 family protein [Microbacterium radiodurans]|uniref:DUF4862 family protein n=1 Tax=Microbacterium radiodurans TaxID=661398 RepID=A0A5J5ISN9_9MICO|nr:DUF4862 family protein [Microbacterium radiodurans]KAA9089104.1 DUF4862 family protein [Microbacterium radiodurans]
MTERIVSAYAAAARELADDHRAEARWYEALRADPLVDGLELSYTNGLHPEGSGRLAALLDPDWSVVVTAIRRTLGAGHRYPAYGLASADDAGRRAAVADVAAMRQHIRELERPVLAVELHSAPNRGRARSTTGDLERSLEEIVSWDWGGSRLIVEHCDAFRSSGEVQKGYLSLAEEMDAMAAVSARFGSELRIALNWGRSAIEAAAPEGAEHHLDLALDAGLLGAYFFSGAAAVESAYGGPWRDVHLPLDVDEPTSLLTTARVASAVRRLPRDLAYVGVKTTAHPERRGIDRLEETLRLLAVVDRCMRGAGPDHSS